MKHQINSTMMTSMTNNLIPFWHQWKSISINLPLCHWWQNYLKHFLSLPLFDIWWQRQLSSPKYLIPLVSVKKFKALITFAICCPKLILKALSLYICILNNFSTCEQQDIMKHRTWKQHHVRHTKQSIKPLL